MVQSLQECASEEGGQEMEKQEGTRSQTALPVTEGTQSSNPRLQSDLTVTNSVEVLLQLLALAALGPPPSLAWDSR